MSEKEIPTLKAPFPWFGGKSRVAPDVWARFGDVANYVEPFFGGGAGRKKSTRERIWFSPHCVSASHVQGEMFS